MIRKIVTAVLLVPLGILIVLFAVANRQIVTVSLDPFGAVPPAFSTTLPLFVILLTTLICGVIFGGVAAWLKQHKWRRAARYFEGEARALREQNELLKRRAIVSDAPPSSGEPLPLLRRPPAA